MRMVFPTLTCAAPRQRSVSRLKHTPRAILLDLGGVLIDVSFERSLRFWHACAGRVAQAQPSSGMGEHDLATEMTTNAALDQAYERHERGEIDFSAFAAALNGQLRLNLHEAQWRQGWNAALGEALPAARQLVCRAAAQWPLFLFSNTNATHHAHWCAQHHELLAPMRAVFVSHRLGLRKPEPQAYQTVAAQMGVNEDLIVFFDDRAQNVEGARRANLQAFQANSPEDVARVLDIDLSLA